MIHARRYVLVAAAFLVTMWGCGGSPPPDAGSTLVLGTLGDVGNWNPYLDDSAFGRDVLGQLYPTLAVEQPDYREHPPSFEPALAERWEVSSDELTLTFTLRPDARWSDGVPVTADDVVFSWEVQRAPEVAWTESWVKEHIVDVRAVDDHTVGFRFDRVYPYQLMDANEGPIVPAHLWRGIPFSDWEATDWQAHAASAGPFVLARHRPHEEITLERNPTYWREGFPRADAVVWRVVPSQSSLVTQLLAGRLHFVPAVAADDTSRVERDPAVRLVVYPDRAYSYVGWNTRRQLFSSAEVRRALTLGIDRRAILEAVAGGDGTIAVGPVLSGMWAFDDDLEPLPYDPTEATRLLAGQGWSDGDGDGILDRDGEPFSFEIVTNVETQTREDICLLISTQLKRIGIRATPRLLEAGSLVAALQEGDFDAYVGGWLEPTKIDLWDLWHSAASGEPSSNFVGYSNPEVDRLLEEVDAATTFADQKPLLDRIQEEIVADQPYTFLYEQWGRAAISERVEGAEINDASVYFNLDEWSLR